MPPHAIRLATFRRLAPRRDAPPMDDILGQAAAESGFPTDIIVERHRFDPRLVTAVRKLIARHSPTIVQTHSVKSHCIVAMSGIWRRHPWIAFHHGYTSTDAKMVLYNQVDRLSLRFARRVVTVCEAFVPELISHGVDPARIRVVPSDISIPELPTEGERRISRSLLGIGGNTRLILAVGRLSKEKGHLDLVAAFAHARQRLSGLDVRLIIAGEGPLKEVIERESENFGVAGYCTLVGHVSDLRPYYAAADLFALPSHSEGSPNALLEAMAFGLPIVATKVGGVGEMVRHGQSAILVAARDPEQMARGFLELIRHPQHGSLLAHEAREQARSQFSSEVRLRRLLNIYCKVVSSSEYA